MDKSQLTQPQLVSPEVPLSPPESPGFLPKTQNSTTNCKSGVRLEFKEGKIILKICFHLFVVFIGEKMARVYVFEVL